MQALLKKIPHFYIGIFACIMIVVGLFWARAILASGMMLLVANAIININVKSIIKQWLQNPMFLAAASYVGIIAFSGLWSSNVKDFASELQLHLPLLFVPLGICSISFLNKKWLSIILSTYVIVVAISCGWSLVHYLKNKDAIEFGYHLGHSMQVVFKKDHIRFGIAVVLAVWCCLQLWHSYGKRINYLLVATISYFIIYLHILSAKTSLLSLYLLIAYLIFNLIFKRKNYLLGILLSAALIATPILAYNVSTTFKTKIDYTIYSFRSMQNHIAETNISDEGRILSYQLSWPIIKQNIVIGIGAGDVKSIMDKQYKAILGANNKLKVLVPHNQLMVAFLIGGIIAGIIFIWLWFAPLIYSTLRHSSIVQLWFIFLVPFLVEPFLETQYGIALFIFFFALILRYLHICKQSN